jgi:ABC-type transporter Mla subunit MlaD
MSAEYVTRDELNHALRDLVHELHEAVATLSQRMDRLEHAINRLTVVFGTTQFVLLLLVLLILRKVGL